MKHVFYLCFTIFELFRFVVDESFLATVEDHCRLEINTGCSYSLVKSEDLPPDFVLDPIEEDSENGRLRCWCLWSAGIIQ